MAQTPHFIIVNPGRGASPYPAQHITLPLAINEAQRLARQSPGQKFVIYEAVCQAEVPTVVVTGIRQAFDDEIPF